MREATDLVQLVGEHVALKPKGREYVGLCPFHDDHSPSLSVVTHKGHAFYKCFACGASGDAFRFVMDYHKKDFGEALRYLAERAGVRLTPREREASRPADGPSRDDLREANRFAARFFRRVLEHPMAGRAARELIASRGISPEMSEAFNLGLAPDRWDGLVNALRKRGLSEHVFEAAGLLKRRPNADGRYDAFRNRLMFPILDDLGNPVAFGGRRLDPEDEPKYLNSAESTVFRKSRTLYGLHRARRAIIAAGAAIVTEGYTDVIACHQSGVENVVGTLGTALTREHARLLSRLCDTVVLVFDGDEAGRRAADRAVEVFFLEPVDVRICVLPDGLDPDELLRQEHGTERLHAAVAGAVDALEFKVGRFREELRSATGVSARQKVIERFLAELADLGFGAMQGIRKRMVTSQLADLTGLPVAEIERSMPKARTRAAAAPAPDTPAPASGEMFSPTATAVSRARRVAERALLGLLLFDPEACVAVSVDRDGEHVPLPDAIVPDDFGDRASRAIIEFVLPRLRSQPPPRIQTLLGELADDEAREVASGLYFEAARRCGDEPGAAATHVAEVFATLRNRLRLERYHQDASAPAPQAGDDDPDDRARSVLERIQKRREMESLPGAIHQGARS